jgi:hypothetical protein
MMPRDALEQLLRQADAAAPAPPLAAGLPARVQQRLARRRQRQATAAVIPLAIVMGVSILLVLRGQQPRAVQVDVRPATPSTTKTITTTTPSTAAVPLRGVGDDLALTAALHELTAEKLLASSAFARRRASTPTIPTASEVQMLRDRAALVLVYEADRDVKENRPAAALARYRRAVQLFPHTHWARVAQQRLKEMPT